MRDLLNGVPGERLAGDSYWERFERDFWQVGAPGAWKIERLQHFREPGDPSWVAFTDGNWPEALRLAEAERSGLREEYQKIAGRGFACWRVRVVEKPITPYLQWEFHCFLHRARAGENIRVVDSDRIAQFEQHSVFPEIITLGTDVLYKIWYDESGLQQGGIRFTDRDLVARYQRIIAGIYADGEDLERFFDREIANLHAPVGV